ERPASRCDDPILSPEQSTGLRLDWLPFFVTAAAPTELCPLSLHDALPICSHQRAISLRVSTFVRRSCRAGNAVANRRDRRFGSRSEEQRLNSSHVKISYAVFCLKKKPACAPAASRPGRRPPGRTGRGRCGE